MEVIGESGENTAFGHGVVIIPFLILKANALFFVLIDVSIFVYIALTKSPSFTTICQNASARNTKICSSTVTKVR